MVQVVKNPPAMQETQVWPLGWEDLLGKGVATHSSIFSMGRGGWLTTVRGVERARHIQVTNTFLWVMWSANHFTLLGFSFFTCKLEDITYWILNFILPSCIILWFLILSKLLWLSTGILVLIQLSVYSANTTEHLWCTRAALDSRK